jgi:hypothetical protein
LNTVFYFSASNQNQLELPSSWQNAVLAIVPFWAMFTVDLKTCISLNFMIFLPESKQSETELSIGMVLKRIDDAVMQLKQKVKKILLLQDVLSKNQLAPELKLANPPVNFKFVLDSIEEERGRKLEEDSKRTKELEDKKRDQDAKQSQPKKTSASSKPASKIGTRFQKMMTMQVDQSPGIDSTVGPDSSFNVTSSNALPANKAPESEQSTLTIP